MILRCGSEKHRTGLTSNCCVIERSSNRHRISGVSIFGQTRRSDCPLSLREISNWVDKQLLRD